MLIFSFRFLNSPSVLERFRKYWGIVEYYYPLSFLGSFSFFIFLYLQGYAVSTGNLYALLLGVPGIFFIIGQVVFIRFWAFRNGNVEYTWGSWNTLLARSPESCLQMKLSSVSPPYFFRYHCVFRGKLCAGKEARFYYFKEASSSMNGDLNIDFYFPLCGTLSCHSRILVRDILGISRTRIGPTQSKQFVVRPPILEERSYLPNYAATSLESQKNQRQSEEDKYSMREYIPGDRLKDINWKSSIRLGEMITRVSPQSPEPNPLLSIELRNLNYQKKDTVTSILHLNLLKSWLFSFVLQVHHESPKHRFFIATAKEEYIIENDKDIDNFALDLSKLEYVEDGQWLGRGPSVLEKFIFSTAYDPSLKTIASRGESMGSAEDVKYHVFQVWPMRSIRLRKKIPLVRLFPLEHSVPWTGKWVLRFAPEPLHGLPVGGSTASWKQMKVRSRIF